MISLPPKGGPGLEEVEVGMEGGPSRNYRPKTGQRPSGEGGDREEPGLSGTRARGGEAAGSQGTEI